MENLVRKALIENLTVSVEIAGKALGLSKNPAYEACKSGQIQSIKIGGRVVVPTAPLRKMLGIETEAA